MQWQREFNLVAHCRLCAYGQHPTAAGTGHEPLLDANDPYLSLCNLLLGPKTQHCGAVVPILGDFFRHRQPTRLASRQLPQKPQPDNPREHQPTHSAAPPPHEISQANGMPPRRQTEDSRYPRKRAARALNFLRQRTTARLMPANRPASATAPPSVHPAYIGEQSQESGACQHCRSGTRNGKSALRGLQRRPIQR